MSWYARFAVGFPAVPSFHTHTHTLTDTDTKCYHEMYSFMCANAFLVPSSSSFSPPFFLNFCCGGGGGGGGGIVGETINRMGAMYM